MDLPTVVTLRPPPLGLAGKKRATLRSVLRLLPFVVVGVLCGHFGDAVFSALAAPMPGATWAKLALLCSLPLCWLIAVAVHEMGHLVGGWLRGGRFLLLAVGPLVIRRTPTGLRVARNRSVNVAGGMAVCLPRDPAQMTLRFVAVMILGGPLASLLLAAVLLGCAALVRTVNPAGALPGAIAQNLAVITAGFSLLVFVATAVPSAVGGFKSDGKRVFEFLRGGPRSEQEAALLVLTAAGLNGVRPADYDPSLVARATALRDGSLFDLYGHLTVYFHAADRGEWAVAQSHLDYVLAGEVEVVPYVRDVLRCEYAWLLAEQTPAVALARAWLESAGKLDFDPATQLRAEAAVLLAEGRPGEAAAKAREGLSALERRTMSPVKSPFAAAALESILRRATATGG